MARGMFGDPTGVRGPDRIDPWRMKVAGLYRATLVAGPVAVYIAEQGQPPRPPGPDDDEYALTEEYIVRLPSGDLALWYCEGMCRLAAQRAAVRFEHASGADRPVRPGDQVVVRRGQGARPEWIVGFAPGGNEGAP